MKDKLIIIGASGHGKVVADIAMKMNRWQTIVFLDDDETVKTCLGFEVVGKIADFTKYKDKAEFFVAIGNNATREKIQEQLEMKKIVPVSLVHPNAIIGMEVEIFSGTVVMAGVVINSSSRIGRGCIINTSSSLDHDNIIDDFVHISPGSNLAGTVSVGKGSWIGIGSVISNNVTICSLCKLGAGAVATDDITKAGIYVGIPVRKID